MFLADGLRQIVQCGVVRFFGQAARIYRRNYFRLERSNHTGKSIYRLAPHRSEPIMETNRAFGRNAFARKVA